MKRVPWLIAVLLVPVLLTSCGGDEPDHGVAASFDTSNSGPHNQQDVDFAVDLITLNGQTVAMARMAASRTNSGEVQQLSDEIEATRGAEIKLLSAWLEGWGEDVPSTAIHDMGAMEHDVDHRDIGAVTDDEMEKLSRAQGAEFDRLWLEAMIAQRDAASATAEDQIAEGRNRDAIAMAKSVMAERSDEVSAMEDLLAS